MRTQQQKREYNRARYHELKRQNKCVVCTIRTDGKTKCEACMELARRFQDVRRANGLCVRCGKNEAVRFTECVQCRFQRYCK